MPFVLDSAQKDAFRLPKALLGETLALLSLFFLALAWKGPEEWRRLLRAPFVAMFGPFLVIATLLSLASPHRGACPPRPRRPLDRGARGLGLERRLLAPRAAARRSPSSVVPASILAAVAILQFHGLYQPYNFVGIAESSRFAIGSLAGNVGDLAAALVLPALLAQAEIARGRSGVGLGRCSRAWRWRSVSTV